jgi:hypothetical protein
VSNGTSPCKELTIEDHGNFLSVAGCEDVVEEGRFAGSEIT